MKIRIFAVLVIFSLSLQAQNTVESIKEFRAKYTIRTGKLSIENKTTADIRIYLYHPDSPGGEYSIQDVKPGITSFFMLTGNPIVLGNDWGIKVTNLAGSSKLMFVGNMCPYADGVYTVRVGNEDKAVTAEKPKENIETKQSNSEVTYFDEDWKITQKDNAFYYRIGSAINGDCKDYFISGKLQMTGHYDNGLKNGKFTYYYENGEQASERNYINGIEDVKAKEEETWTGANTLNRESLVGVKTTVLYGDSNTPVEEKVEVNNYIPHGAFNSIDEALTFLKENFRRFEDGEERGYHSPELNQNGIAGFNYAEERDIMVWKDIEEISKVISLRSTLIVLRSNRFCDWHGRWVQRSGGINVTVNPVKADDLINALNYMAKHAKGSDISEFIKK